MSIPTFRQAKSHCRRLPEDVVDRVGAPEVARRGSDGSKTRRAVGQKVLNKQRGRRAILSPRQTRHLVME
jgi:hypothetical protein